MNEQNDYNDSFLSVVIISRNEECNIAKSVESVLKAVEKIENPEVILVDSASDDKTVEIARKYPIKILQLRSSWQLSPSAGCYIGFLYSKGKYVQFLGADMILNEEWLSHAIPFLEKNDNVAGVSGFGTQEKYDNKLAETYINLYKNQLAGEVTYFTGATLFKRQVLQKTGPFNPFLRAGEEGELCYRIITQGYKLLILPHHITHHLGCRNANFSGLVKGMIISSMAQGQILRYSLNFKRIFQWRLREYRFKIASIFLILFGLLSLIELFIHDNIMPFYILSVGMVLYLGWSFYEVKYAKKAIYYGVSQALKSIPFIWGFLKPKKDPDKYPTDVEVIKS